MTSQRPGYGISRSNDGGADKSPSRRRHRGHEHLWYWRGWCHFYGVARRQFPAGRANRQHAGVHDVVCDVLCLHAWYVVRRHLASTTSLAAIRSAKLSKLPTYGKLASAALCWTSVTGVAWRRKWSWTEWCDLFADVRTCNRVVPLCRLVSQWRVEMRPVERKILIPKMWAC